mmetsp:Transcript_14289/g.32449  ORF Transcript_14289/g.32449 Transcript_14289/m.32449 type:complete len:273 (-) Transcript_14289:90-908(-)
MARWQQCLHGFAPFQMSARSPAFGEQQRELSDVAAEPQAPLRFRVSVDGFQLGTPVVFKMTVHHGDAVWRIRRRYKQVWAVHMSLLQGLGRSSIHQAFPHPPPRSTLRSCMFGQMDQQFLRERAAMIECYINALLRQIPLVEHCEALFKFLCYTTLRNWEYGAMISGGAPPVDAAAVANLPRASSRSPSGSSTASSGCQTACSLAVPAKAALCVICQDSMEFSRAEDDIRVLPCGHEFHFRCISQWLRERNTCCICQGAAILTAPRLTWQME